MDKCLLKKPTKITFRNQSGDVSPNNGSVSHRRRSGVQDDTVIIDDLKLGE